MLKRLYPQVTLRANIDKGTPIMDIRRKRLAYRANYRGIKEADLILGGFAKAHIESLSDEELTMFEHLLNAADQDIYDWVSGKMPVPAQYDTSLFEKIRQFKPV